MTDRSKYEMLDCAYIEERAGRMLEKGVWICMITTMFELQGLH